MCMVCQYQTVSGQVCVLSVRVRLSRQVCVMCVSISQVCVLSVSISLVCAFSVSIRHFLNIYAYFLSVLDSF